MSNMRFPRLRKAKPKPKRSQYAPESSELENNDRNNPGITRFDRPFDEETELQNIWLSEATRQIEESIREQPQTGQMVQGHNSIGTNSSLVASIVMGNNESKKKGCGVAYVHENNRLQRQRKKTRKVKKVKSIVTNQLPNQDARLNPIETLIEIERRHAKSVVKIQRCFRQFMRRKFWKVYYRKVKAATNIQRIIRGVICRKLIGLWHQQTIYFATRIQALVRGYLYRRVIHTVLQWESLNARRMQNGIRKYLAVKRVSELRREMAAVHIQAAWRGHKGRCYADFMWLCAKATLFQRLVRGALARRKCLKLRRRKNKACVRIQKRFRGVMARERVRALVRERESQNRREFIDMLHVEEEYFSEHSAKLVRRLTRSKLRDEVTLLEETLFNAHEDVFEMESTYFDLQIQRRKVSPRSIEQGWVTEVNETVSSQRKAITRKKLEILEYILLPLRKKQWLLMQTEKEIHRAEQTRQRFQEQRSDELVDFWMRESQYQYHKQREQELLSIAENRRKWRVKFYTPEGKPDTFRGSRKVPYNADPWSNKELNARETFSSATCDIIDSDSVEEDEHGAKVSRLLKQWQVMSMNAQASQLAGVLEPALEPVSSLATFIEQNAGLLPPDSNVPVENGSGRVHQYEEKSPKQHHDGNVEGQTLQQHTHQGKRKRNKSKSSRKTVEKLQKESKVPWVLLDKLQVEKTKLKVERIMNKYQ